MLLVYIFEMDNVCTASLNGALCLEHYCATSGTCLPQIWLRSPLPCHLGINKSLLQDPVAWMFNYSEPTGQWSLGQCLFSHCAMAQRTVKQSQTCLKNY